MRLQVDLPALSLVLLVGPSAAGKSTFARTHFAATEVVSSDACRAALCDDANDQTVTATAFELLHFIVSERLRLGRLTVVDATNVQASARAPLIALARERDVACVAVVFDLPADVLVARHRRRTDRPFDDSVIVRQQHDLAASIDGLQRERCRPAAVFRSVADVDGATVRRRRLAVDRRDDAGPFDIVGDVHGCFDELIALVDELGYAIAAEGEEWNVRHPDGRRLVFVGDLADRGPDSPAVLRFARSVVRHGGFCVAGNHDAKLVKALRGRAVTASHGLERTLQQLDGTPAVERDAIADFLDRLPSHYVLDGGRLVVAHAGLPEAMHGRVSGRVRAFASYGQTSGEVDDDGLPVRGDWAKDYRGKATVVYGHTPVRETRWVNDTICLDTGCVFGGRLTALRYPERELVSVAARRTYCEPARPLASPSGSSVAADDGAPAIDPPALRLS